jgi:DNA-binding ferritin-like protein
VQSRTTTDTPSWSVVGPLVRPLHVYLDELIDSWRELVGVAERVRERMNRLAELASASEDVLVGVVRALEEQLWMIRAQLTHHQEA